MGLKMMGLKAASFCKNARKVNAYEFSVIFMAISEFKMSISGFVEYSLVACRLSDSSCL